MTTITLNNLSDFERGFLTAALWTMDDDAPSGEYSTSGRFEQLFPQIDQQSLHTMLEGDCKKFQEDNKILLSQAGDASQNGHDFLLSRNGHGCGFFDRGYDNEAEGSTLSVGDVLTDLCHAYGECDLYEGDDGKLYFSP